MPDLRQVFFPSGFPSSPPISPVAQPFQSRTWIILILPSYFVPPVAETHNPESARFVAFDDGSGDLHFKNQDAYGCNVAILFFFYHTKKHLSKGNIDNEHGHVFYEWNRYIILLGKVTTLISYSELQLWARFIQRYFHENAMRVWYVCLSLVRGNSNDLVKGQYGFDGVLMVPWQVLGSIPSWACGEGCAVLSHWSCRCWCSIGPVQLAAVQSLERLKISCWHKILVEE